ncbi:MAG TPA: hypothetical protein PKA30_16675, partial [Accumulibacter sp.]|uniref:hypothetical protein n=1 Tax=Accumulibacter sp. TaxID=2053492 RepID=UPI002C675E8F
RAAASGDECCDAEQSGAAWAVGVAPPAGHAGQLGQTGQPEAATGASSVGLLAGPPQAAMSAATPSRAALRSCRDWLLSML